VYQSRTHTRIRHMGELLTPIWSGARRYLPAALSGPCDSYTAPCTHEQQTVSIRAGCYLWLRACACLPAHAFLYPSTHAHVHVQPLPPIMCQYAVIDLVYMYTNLCVYVRTHNHTYTHAHKHKHTQASRFIQQHIREL